MFLFIVSNKDVVFWGFFLLYIFLQLKCYLKYMYHHLLLNSDFKQESFPFIVRYSQKLIKISLYIQ